MASIFVIYYFSVFILTVIYGIYTDLPSDELITKAAVIPLLFLILIPFLICLKGFYLIFIWPLKQLRGK